MASATAVAKLAPNDPRVEYKDVQVNGRSYHYMLARPPAGAEPRATILLVHGFPDLGFGWRHQVPALAAHGFQVVVPDVLGYGGTDAPHDVEPYRHKSVIDDLLAVLDSQDLIVPLGPTRERRVVLGGHDWGGQVVWRFTEWHPDRVAATFSVCTPYFPPMPSFVDLQTLTRMIPNFKYQLQFASDEVVDRTTGPDGKPSRADIRNFLNALWGGVGVPQTGAPDAPRGFTASNGVDFSIVKDLPRTQLLSAEELDFYADRYARNGMRGPTNWYRVRKVNFEDEQALLERKRKQAEETGGEPKIKTPSLFISASRDVALPPAMSANMDKSFESLTRGHVDASHWALVEAAAEVNAIILSFLDSVFKPKASM
ncbi:hypothetical protein PpBr36_03551 [Pyricularia pennisetigena]|uniref:hypothetical protein n=1 Tax=Pyricularia pennisetigena TaxID=1578925 RepID=UPI001154C1F7|nr:hypothetical protein PpBr36_03551 [Pyricularia pennisetigena]TLS30780.1 hypothetical protein PpBr36_03551 [Pyricularia pennisetigena]